ncbi:hypothetical protein M513_11726 [Trichuris suis]|uniref:G-protein coupled receptors family 1 profile domain-containing protein n=1 Tax=Trichuris suis TaxID=68888 RepID=A0A085LR19_9BILA|nr:hypothetical protein M513_11726 [Trichuris suis]
MISNTNATNGSSSSFCVYSQTMGMHHQIWAKILFILLYTFVFLMAFCGNLLVVYIILMRRRLQNVTNFFICNLAVSDLFVSLTSLWLTPMYGYLGRWVWGNFMCHSVPMIQGAGIFISSLTLTAIAVDRLMLVAPYGLHMELHYSQQCDYHVCRELWEFGELQAAYGFTVMALQFGIPFFIIAICYIRIWHSLSSRKTLVHLKSDSALNRKKRLLKGLQAQIQYLWRIYLPTGYIYAIHGNVYHVYGVDTGNIPCIQLHLHDRYYLYVEETMLILMVTIFGLCWLPFNMLNLWRDLSPGAIDAKSYFVFLFLMSHLIAMSASGWNPVLYAWMNENFSREYRYTFSCLCRGKRRSRSSHPSMTAGQYDVDRTGDRLSEHPDDERLKNCGVEDLRNDDDSQLTAKDNSLKRKGFDFE